MFKCPNVTWSIELRDGLRMQNSHRKRVVGIASIHRAQRQWELFTERAGCPERNTPLGREPKSANFVSARNYLEMQRLSPKSKFLQQFWLLPDSRFLSLKPCNCGCAARKTAWPT
jgi:hypothetical protein